MSPVSVLCSTHALTYLIDGLTVKFTDVVGPGRGLLNHLESDWGKNAVLSPLNAAKVTACPILDVAAGLVEEARVTGTKSGGTHGLPWLEETLILVGEL